MDLTLTGKTCDGTFLIENGKVMAPLRNFRFHHSPMRAFQNINGSTETQEATSVESGQLFVPERWGFKTLIFRAFRHFNLLFQIQLLEFHKSSTGILSAW